MRERGSARWSDARRDRGVRQVTARDDRVAGRGRLEALERLVRSGALPVAVLVEPPRGTGERLPAPAGLGDTVFVGGSPASVEVRYGLPGGRGASARVVTSLPGPGGSRRPPIRALVERLARELPGAGPARPVALDDRPVFLAGRPCEALCQVTDGEGRWALVVHAAAPRVAGRAVAAGASVGRSAAAPRVELTVAAQGYDPSELWLGWAATLRELGVP